MAHAAPLPPEWACLEGRVNCVQQESRTTWTSSCPLCGGDVHPDGAPSDRFVMFCDEHPTGVCRKCESVVYPDQFGDGTYTRPSPEALERRRQEERARQERIKATAEAALRMLADDELWLRFYDDLRADGRAYWERRGVPKPFQDLWQLGMRRGWRLPGTDGNWYELDAASIPLRDGNAKVQNIKYRLVNEPAAVKGRYRYHVRDVPGIPFICNPLMPVEGDVLVIEGEIKAMVVFATLDDANAQAVGMPGLTPGPATVEALKGAERITLVTDPGSRAQAEYLIRGDKQKGVEGLGVERCRLLVTAAKVDDAILGMGADRYDVQRWLRQARKVA